MFILYYAVTTRPVASLQQFQQTRLSKESQTMVEKMGLSIAAEK